MYDDKRTLTNVMRGAASDLQLPQGAVISIGERMIRSACWLAGVLAAYFVFFTIYVAPYLALIPEIAWDERQRVRLAAIMAAVSFPVLTSSTIREQN